jgi:hypothetical protein
VAEANTYYITAMYFQKQVLKSDKLTDLPLIKHLEVLFRIFVYNSIKKIGSPLCVSGHLNAKQLRLIDEALLNDYDLIRPQLLNFAESNAYTDNTIFSVLND